MVVNEFNRGFDRISDVIQRLQQIMVEYGDLTCAVYDTAKLDNSPRVGLDVEDNEGDPIEDKHYLVFVPVKDDGVSATNE